METDKIIIFNKEIQTEPPKYNKLLICKLNEYSKIYKFLKTYKSNTKTIYIYDVTFIASKKHLTHICVNDHINRTGANPFIGKQKDYRIDFINVEDIYIKDKNGIITNSIGDEYTQQKKKHVFPSTYLANVAALASTLNYKVKGILINSL